MRRSRTGWNRREWAGRQTTARRRDSSGLAYAGLMVARKTDDFSDEKIGPVFYVGCFDPLAGFEGSRSFWCRSDHPIESFFNRSPSRIEESLFAGRSIENRLEAGP